MRKAKKGKCKNATISKQLLLLLGSTLLLPLISGAVSSSDLTVKEQRCCQDGDYVTLEFMGCHSGSGNGTYNLPLNCTQHYVIYQEVEHEVHVGPKGTLVDGSYEVAWEEYCSAALSESDGIQQVFVVCFNGDEYATSVSFFLMKGVMMLISVFFLAITLYIYHLIPDLRETQDRVTSIAVACLMFFMLLLGLVQLGSSSIIHGTVCEMIGKHSIVIVITTTYIHAWMCNGLCVYITLYRARYRATKLCKARPRDWNARCLQYYGTRMAHRVASHSDLWSVDRSTTVKSSRHSATFWDMTLFYHRRPGWLHLSTE